VPEVGQILLVDSDADPLHHGGARGAVFLISTRSPNLFFASVHTGLLTPVAAASAADRRVYVVDADADPLGLGRDFGCLWVVDAAVAAPGTAKLAAASPLFRHPSDLLVEPEGTVLLLDSDADPNNWGGHNGAVFRVDPSTGGVDVVAAPAGFSQPRCLAWDLDGNVLVLDQAANPQGSVYGAGAIFRLNRQTGTVSVKAVLTRPRFIAPCAVAVIPSGPDAGDLLVVDKDADPDEWGTRPGAVFRIPKRGGQPTVVAAYERFSEPVDIVIGLDGDFIILDKKANPQNFPTAQGAVFRFALDGGGLLRTWTSSLFQDLAGLTQVEGASVDSSVVTWTDENQGLTRPGDFVTVRARLRNAGNAPAPTVVLTDTLTGPWNFVAGSDSVSRGISSFNPVNGVLTWSSSLGIGDSASIRFRLRVSDTAPVGVSTQQALTVRLGLAPKRWKTTFVFLRELPLGSTLFVDYIAGAGDDIGRLYAINPDSLAPAQLYSGAPLRRPSDLTFMDDGSVAILDRSSPRGELGAILRYSTQADSAVSTLFPLTRADGFSQPAGIALDRDGSLLIVDRDANPNSYPSPNSRPGALFRLDPMTRQLSLVLSDQRWADPVDAAVDRSGHILVIDFEGGGQRQGAVTEITPGQATPLLRELSSGLFKDPIGLMVDRSNYVYISDPNSPAGSNDRGGAVERWWRPGGSFSLVTADTLLRQPSDCAMAQNGDLFVTDREANPLRFGSGDRGAVFRMPIGGGQLEVACATRALTAPDGIAILGAPDFSYSSMAIQSRAGAMPAPGDTMRFNVSLVNTGMANSPKALAEFRVSDNLKVETGSAARGAIGVDPDNGLASWSGRVAMGDTVRFAVRTRVTADAVFGTNAGAQVTVRDGRSPVTFTQSRTLRAPFAAGEILVADEGSNLGAPGYGPGALFRLPAKQRPARFLYRYAAVRQFSALEWSPSGELIVAASRGADPGMLYRFNTTTGGLIQYGTVDSLFKTPVDLCFSPQGDLYAVDRDARGPTVSSTGAIFRKAGGVGPLTLFTNNAEFESPQQMAFGPGGLIYLADSGADPGHVGGQTGTIFALRPEDGTVVSAFQSPNLPEPTGIIAYDDTTMIVTDATYHTAGSDSRGALFRYNPGRGTLELLINSPVFRSLWRTMLLSSGDMILLDRTAAGPSQGGSPGTILSFSPVGHQLQYFAWSDSFAVLSDVVQRPGPLVDFASYTLNDINGPPLHPADRLEVRAVLRNRGPAPAREISWTDTIPTEAALLPATVHAGSGQAISHGTSILTWSGEIASGDSVVIGYTVQLNPAQAEGKLLRFRAWVEAAIVGTASRTVTALTHVPLEPGYLYVLDQRASPFGEPGVIGALFKTNLITGSTVPMFTSRQFLVPRTVAMVGATSPQFLILDEAAHPAQGHGALFRQDPSTGDVSLVATDPTWVRPRKVLPLSEDEALVLDPLADPFSLTPGPGPGALYSVNLNTGAVSVVISDTNMVAPSSMALMKSGLLAISDEDADPAHYGLSNGAIFTLDLQTHRLRILSTSAYWRTPKSITSTPDGGLLLIDEEAVPISGAPGHGSLFTISPGGQVMVTALSPFFTRLADVQVDPSGNPILIDSEADPFHYGYATGAVFVWDPNVVGKFVPLGSSPYLRKPVSFVVYRDPVPAGILEATAETEAEGIRIRWQGPPAEEGDRFLVYRRIATGPQDPGDATPAEYDLVSGEADFLGPGPHEFIDRQTEPGSWYVYIITQIDPMGGVLYGGPLLAQAPASTLRLELSEALPNPFRGTTVLRFSVPAPGGKASLDVFDVTGRRVRTLVKGGTTPGWQSVVWDGRDDAGHPVASGLFFSRLSYAGKTRTVRIVLVK
jgi:uncharacterized repeat protein (TIGR01451 family)